MLLELLIFLFCDLIHNHHTAKLNLQPCIGIKCSVEFNLLPFFRLYIAYILLDLICNHLAKFIYFATSYVIKRWIISQLLDFSHNILSLQDLFNVIYGKKIITDFKNGRLDSQGEPLEPSPEEGRHFIIVDKNLNSELGTQQYFSLATM